MILAIVIIEICLSIVLKGTLNDLINLILSLQLVIAFMLYDIKLPASVEIFALHIQDVIEFKNLDPEVII
jgi:hypothetical protein